MTTIAALERSIDDEAGLNEPFPIPPESAFVEGDLVHDYLEAPELARLAREVIAQHSDVLVSHDEIRIRYVWRRRGPVVNDRPVFGRCTRASGLVRFFGKADAIISLSADHLRELRPTRHAIEAILYHELSHIEVVEDKEGIMRVRIRPHDAEVFTEEIRRFGLWWDDLRRLGEAVKQAALWDA